MNTKKELIILAKNIDGGTGTFLHQLLKLSKKFSITVVVIEKPKYRKITHKGITFHYFSHFYSYKYNELKLLFNFLKELLWIKNILLKHKNVTVISIDTHCNILACLMKIIFNNRLSVITTTHNNITAVAANKLSRISIWFLKKIGHLLFQYADYQIGVSHGVSKDLQAFFSLKDIPKTIYYGLDIKKIKQLSNKQIEKDDKLLFKKKTILSIGRFERQKDFFTLIKAFALVRQKHDIQLILIGDGAQKKQLQDQVKNLSISKDVTFLGWKSNVYPYIKTADLFVLSTHYEGLPYVLIEALILGKAIVSTDCKFGPDELLLKGKAGILIPESNYQEMSTKLLELLKNLPRRKRYEKNSEMRGTFFTEQKMLNQYAQLINTLV